jgi:hypothetical protein
MAKATEVDRVVELEREVADLKRRLDLLEMFVDSEHREKMGITLDDIRALWRGSRARRLGHGASPHDGRIEAV